MKPFLFVALDGLADNETETLKKAEQLCLVNSPNFGFKINFDYLLLKGLKAGIETVQQFKRPVFADLKMNHGSRTMKKVVAELVSLGVEYTNIYALADKLMHDSVKLTEDSQTKILGVTILTHFYNDDSNRGYIQKYFDCPGSALVASLAHYAVDNGCHGVILPGNIYLLDLLKLNNFSGIKAVPGIRPSWYKDDRHSQTIEPAQAVAHGTDILVCGDPIMKDTGPVVALQKILSEMEGPT